MYVFRGNYAQALTEADWLNLFWKFTLIYTRGFITNMDTSVYKLSKGKMYYEEILMDFNEIYQLFLNTLSGPLNDRIR